MADSLPPAEGDFASLKALVEKMKSTKDADEARIAKLEKQIEDHEAKLNKANEKVKSAGLFDLF